MIHMSLGGEDRKIQSNKFYVTLPKSWRESHGLLPGQAITAHFKGSSPLILLPKGAQLSQLDTDLITLLLEGPSVNKLKEITAKFNSLAKVFGSAAAKLYNLEEEVYPGLDQAGGSQDFLARRADS